MRWCTRQLKLKPFEKYVGNDEVVSYVGIRADEDREGYISTKPNIKAASPSRRTASPTPTCCGSWRTPGWACRILQVAEPVRVLLLLLPAQGRVGRAPRTAPRSLRGGQGVREGRSGDRPTLHVGAGREPGGDRQGRSGSRRSGRRARRSARWRPGRRDARRRVRQRRGRRGRVSHLLAVAMEP